jgi:hypothetical protein
MEDDVGQLDFFQDQTKFVTDKNVMYYLNINKCKKIKGP